MSDPLPLAGVRVVEFAGIGPGPYAAMILSDWGAEVVRFERGVSPGGHDPVTMRGRASIDVDLKSEAGRNLAAAAMAKADVVIEGYRPGVMERLGLGPEAALAANPRLIYGRITGWGQDGPLADTAGHDINYIAITGALDEIGEAGRPPVPPINLVGDFAGGSLFLVLGIMLALHERTNSGKGQVIDAAIVDGTASLLAPLLGLRDLIGIGRGANQLGGASPTYRTYRCADGKHVAVGAIEEPFWNELADGLGLSTAERRRDPLNAALLHARLEALFLTAPQAEWIARLGTRNSCIAPVLSVEDARDHPHLAARGTYQTLFGHQQPAPAPRLSRTPGQIAGPAPEHGHGGRETLARWGLSGDIPGARDNANRAPPA